MRLQILKREEYVLDYNEFLIEKREKSRKDAILDNRLNFISDFEAGKLNRYVGTYVAYKDGVLCGQSKDEELLHREAGFNLCIPIDIFNVPKNRENINLE